MLVGTATVCSFLLLCNVLLNEYNNIYLGVRYVTRSGTALSVLLNYSSLVGIVKSHYCFNLYC